MASADVGINVRVRDAREATRDLNNVDASLGRAGRSADRAGRLAASGSRGFDRMSRGVRGLAGLAGKGLLGGLAVAAGAAAAGGAFLKGAFAEAQDAQKVGAITANAIKATGGAANLSADQVGKLSEAISAKSGIDDEAIQSGANLLLTFKNVREEVGKGNDVFTRATQAAVDLNAADFGSIAGNSKMLGKALNDPIKGMSALSKNGVTFTQEQEDMAKAMVESGDILGAQKLILKEVEGQVGGAAAAQATASDKMQVAWGNLKEQVGTALMPVFEKVFGYIGDKVVPAISTFVDQVQDGTGAGGRFREIMTAVYERGLKPVGNFIMDTVVPAVREFISGMRDGTGLGGKFADFARGLGDTLRPIGIFIRDTVVPAVRKFIGEMNSGEGAGGVFVDVLTKIWGGAKKVADFIIRTLIPNLAAFAGFVIREVVPKVFRIAGALLSMGIFGVKAFRLLLQGAFTTFGGILAAADKGLGWIPGLGDKISGARAAFDEFGDKTIRKLEIVEAGLVKARDRANELGKDRSARIDVVTYFSSVGTPNKAARDLAITGGALAKGTPYARGGTTLVGERGPELVNLPRGSEVLTATRTRQVFNSPAPQPTPRMPALSLDDDFDFDGMDVQVGPGEGGTTVIQVVLDGKVLTEAVVDGLTSRQARA